MIYLASPYYHKDPEVREVRHRKVRQLTLQMLSRGQVVFSPIVYGVALLPELDTWGHDEWMWLDLGMLSRCVCLMVYQLPGWEASRGVLEEIQHATEIGIPVRYIPYGKEEEASTPFA